MTANECITGRRSIRKFTEQPVAHELIEKIVVHSPEKISGKKHVTIEVYFTYVGKSGFHLPNRNY